MRPLFGSLAIAATALPALGGPKSAIEPIVTEEHNNGSFCDWLSGSPGELYKNKENPFISKVKIFGRAHYQAVYVDGDEGSELIQDFRRLRSGAQVDFLKFFTAKATVNLVDDDRQAGDDLGFGYESFEDATLKFEFGKAFGLDFFDDAELVYGKQKVEIGHEQHLSSKKIKTIERSAMANFVRPANSTGTLLFLEKGDWAGSFAYYSADEENELSGDYDQSYYYASITRGFGDDSLTLDYIKSDNNGEGEGIDYDWASAASYNIERDMWSLAIDTYYGEKGDAADGDRGGNFYGVTVLPTYWIVQDRLELVGRYAFQGSNEDEGVRVGSRYTRDPGNSSDTNGVGSNGRGDAHHAVYLGLNYYLCGDNAKFLFGVEYDTISTDNEGQQSALTYGGAFRMFF